MLFATGLDSSGKTIPANNYPVPAGAIFMSPTGNDANAGTQSAPVKTLNRAVALVPAAGGTIVLRGGVYRDRYSNADGTVRHINKSVTLQAYPGEKPWFDGTDLITTGWAPAGSVWVRDWSTPQFCGGTYDVPVNGLSPVSPQLTQNSPCSYADSIADPAHPVAGDPQLAFINDEQLTQKGTLAEVTAGSKSFYYDWYAKKIYVSENPSTNPIALATRADLLVFGGAYDFGVKGVGFRRFASSILGASVIFAGLGGASTLNAGSLTVENSVFTENAGVALSISGPKTSTAVTRSVFAFNHYTPLQGNGFANSNPGVPNAMLIEDNVFNGNNAGQADTKCTASCGAAAVKLCHMTGFVTRRNVFENTLGKAPGFWCDMDCSKGVIVGNISRNNGGHGLFYEISNTGIIANNLVYNNQGSGITVCAANTKVYNNTVVNTPGPNVQAIWLWDDKRVAPDKGATWPYVNPRVDLGPNTNNVEFANNLIVAQQPTGARLMNFADGSNVAPNTQSNEYFSVLDNNIYYTLTNQNLYMWGDTDAIKTTSALRTVSGQNWENNTVQVVGTGDPFVSRAGLDFTLRTDSQAYLLPGRALPADVAAATGLTGAVHRGASIH